MVKRRRVAGPEGDLAVKLRDQIEYLQRSCRDYDAGHWNEAQRLATTLRVLFHDGRDRSLLKQMQLRSSLRMENAVMTFEQFEADQRPEPTETPGISRRTVHLTQRPGLVGVGIATGGIIWTPRLANHPPTEPVGFDRWWNDPVIAGDDGRTFTRSQVVLAMANKDGGAHVSDLPERYADLLEDTLGQLWATDIAAAASASGGNFGPPLNTIAHASIRQIAYEVLVTFDRDLHAYLV